MRAPVVIKIGGGTLDHLDPFWDQLKLIKPPPVIVHGGGVQSSILANHLGHSPRIINGRRVTGDLDLNIAEWTMRGAINVRLVAEANARELKAVGLSGVDGSILNVRRREPWLIDDEMVDFGWVGEIVSID
ncbi:MAG: acetylglutamate kinase, partial [Rhodothermaceae bacterium]|nr:acetylglutamate kinase [Rhodothermaceae bacterium]